MVICVTKNLVDNSYINDYWKNNLIIDNTKTSTKNITEEVNKEFYDNLDNNYTNKNNYNTNKNNNYTNKNNNYTNKNNYNSNKNNNYTNSNYNSNNNNYYLKTTYNNQSQNEGYYKKPYENRNFHKNTNKEYNKNTNKEYTLPTESRNKEFYNGQRKILLDSFSKPKLV